MVNETEISHDFDLKVWSNFLETVLSEESFWTPIAFAIINLIIFVVGLVGNLLTCIVIYCDKTMHTATNYYLFNLAVSDLIITFAILLEVNEHLDRSFQFIHYSFGPLACKIHFFSIVTLWNNSILTMTALAIERYLAICYPLLLKSAPVWRRVMKIIVINWIIAIAETVPELWTVDLIRTKRAAICYTVPTPLARVINGVLALLTFIIPLGIMMFVYSMIAMKINVSQKNNSKDNVFNQRDNRSKVNKLIALTISFLVCWLPFFILRTMIFTFDTRQLMRLNQWFCCAYRISSVNSWFSIVLNPLLFSLMSTKFRKSLKLFWDRKVIRRRHDENRATVV